MELKEYFNILLKRAWLVIALPVIAALISAYVSFYMLTPVYEANTTLYIINKTNGSEFQIAYNDLLISQQLVKDYKEFVKSRRVISQVIEQLGIEGISASAMAAKVNVNAKNETRFIEIRVQDSNPALAADIANKLADVFKNEVVEYMKVENVNIVDTAQQPGNPIKPKPMMNIAVAFIAGLLFGAGLAFAIEYLDDTIKSAEDVEKYLGVTVLGAIPEFSGK
ncbi:MAG TPA: Wzz/FepE/Etk N-terminal domain-containing protein [Clostridiales bacterium]|nr:Wzz/FepE/Etk N-terminal domain-containing protein [Clostridiales bacterium]